MKSLRRRYAERRASFLEPVAGLLRAHLRQCLSSCTRIDQVSARAKGVDRFVAKASQKRDGKIRYGDPLNQIQDQVGARVVTFYLSDVEPIKSEVLKYFRPIESRRVVPDTETSFSYFGHHFILLLPTDLTAKFARRLVKPDFFELQIHTLFQHAWAEAEHDLGYKPSGAVGPEEKRKIAFTAAQAWGADMIFDELARRAR